MTDWYKVKVKVISQKGQCETGHKVGDEFIIEGTAPAGICAWALYTLFPFISALQSGGSFHGKRIRIQQPSPAPTRQIQLCLN